MRVGGAEKLACKAGPNTVGELLGTVGADGALQEGAITWHAGALDCLEDGELVRKCVGVLIADVNNDTGLKPSLDM